MTTQSLKIVLMDVAPEENVHGPTVLNQRSAIQLPTLISKIARINCFRVRDDVKAQRPGR
jgi:hypothetical protein